MQRLRQRAACVQVTALSCKLVTLFGSFCTWSLASRPAPCEGRRGSLSKLQCSRRPTSPQQPVGGVACDARGEPGRPSSSGAELALGRGPELLAGPQGAPPPSHAWPWNASPGTTGGASASIMADGGLHHKVCQLDAMLDAHWH
jgi:hypothetical protein